MLSAADSDLRSGSPMVTDMLVVPVAGEDGMLLNLSCAHPRQKLLSKAAYRTLVYTSGRDSAVPVHP
jgi:hypothetical protein